MVPVVRQDEAHDAVEGGEWTWKRREEGIIAGRRDCIQRPRQQQYQPCRRQQCVTRHEGASGETGAVATPYSGEYGRCTRAGFIFLVPESGSPVPPAGAIRIEGMNIPHTSIEIKRLRPSI